MPLNNEYKRYFIILQEDDKGYEMAAGKIPTGYVKIEIKNGRGKLTAYAQNVKYGEKVDYRMLLIAPAKKAAVDMGRLMVDGSGRGELNIDFDADNVMKSGMDISEFMVAAVQASTATPLSGYTGRDKVQWKNSYHVINKPQDRIDKHQTIQEVVTPVQTQPVAMPQLPKVDLEGVGEIIGNVIEEGKEMVGNVVEGVVDVAQNFVGDVVDSAMDAVQDLAHGAKNMVGEIKQGIENVMEYVVDEENVVPVQPIPMAAPTQMPEPMAAHVVKKETAPIQNVTGPITMQPAAKPKKEPIPVQVVTEPVVMQPAVKPKKEPIPVQVVTEPVVMQPVVKPKKEPVPIQIVTEPVVMQPIVQPEPIPVPAPIVQPAPTPVTPIQMMPQKPLFEAQTEIKAKFVIETETQHEQYKPSYVCEEECPKLDYKDYYYDDESECDCDSDSDSDSDDKDKKKKHHEHEEHCDHHEHHEHHDDHCQEDEEEVEYEQHPFYTSPMYRRLEKVLGRLRDTEPFEDDDSKERWYKVEDDIYLLNSVTIPFMGSLMPLGYPFMSNECVMMIGRKDYVLGVKYTRGRKDRKYINAIMFGIPGMYNKQEERYYSMRGFVHFRPHKSKKHGYWIMTVDLENGEIVMK